MTIMQCNTYADEQNATPLWIICDAQVVAYPADNIISLHLIHLSGKHDCQ